MKIMFNILSFCILKCKQNQHFRYWIFTSLFIICSSFSTSMSQQLLKGNVPAAVASLGLKSIGRLVSNKNLHLAIGLPLRNRAGLTQLLKQLYDPTSPNYHHYLTPVQFTEQFGPTENDYQSVVDFAKQNGLTVIGTTSNRLLLEVEASVADIEKTFHVNMLTYPHPIENRSFYAPDVEPTINLPFPNLQINGINNYPSLHPLYHEASVEGINNAKSTTGSGPQGSFMGNDFRKAYVPNLTYDGKGQIVAVLEFDGYYNEDILYYENLAGLPNVPVQPVLLQSATGTPEYISWEKEVSMDIELVISMAPGLSQVLVYEEPYNKETNISYWLDMLNKVTTDNFAKQISISWQLEGENKNETAENIFLEMQTHGQSFFQASGDKNAYTNLIDFPGDDTNITIVGGTTLTTGSDGSWASESVWHDNTGGSGGGISTQFNIPIWQKDINMSTNGGSPTKRNIPDVSLTASNIYVRSHYHENGADWYLTGTSAAAPLWAGYTALINQRAAAYSHPPIGFLNPLIYSIGKGSTYNSDFHDITSGNNNGFNAVSGYDLCSGWGTPNGLNLMGDLVPNKILVDQKLSTGMQAGTIGKWNGSSFSPRLNPGDAILISPGSTILLQGDQNLYSGEKYNKWRRNNSFETDVSNHHSFQIEMNDNNFISLFQPMNNATIQSQLLETGSIGGSLKFQDPWLIDFQDPNYGNNLRNQGMSAPFNTVNYSSNNLGINTSHIGVILDQTVSSNNFYSLQAPLTQTINNHNSVFYNWSSPGATFHQVGSNPTGYDQKAVVFNDTGAIVTANYKGVNLSNNTSAFSSNSQRKVVRTPANQETNTPETIHLVYESLGKVWYERSTDNGTTWTIANNGKPLSSDSSKLPALDIYNNCCVGIVYQEKDQDSYRIRFTYFNSDGSPFGTTYTIQDEPGGALLEPYSNNANPVIAWTNNQIMFSWQEHNWLKCRSCQVNYFMWGAENWTPITSVGTYNSNAANPTIAVIRAQSDPVLFHLAWQINNTSINYCTLRPYQYSSTFWEIEVSNIEIPSTGSTWPYNHNPQIAVNIYGNVYLTWIGEIDPGTNWTTVINRNKISGIWNSAFNYYGSNVASPTLQFVNCTNDYIIAWSQGDGNSNKFYRSDNFAILDYGILGRSIQVINGNSLDDMYSISFRNFTLPYYFQITHSSVIPKTLTLTALIEAMYVAGGNAMLMTPSVTVELHNATTPYSLVESQTATLSTAGVGTFNFTTAVNGTPYYIVLKYLNTIETWSSTAQSFTNNSLSYDFTTGLDKAYTDGSNPPLALHNGKYCIYSGDCNQDGFVTGDDCTGIDNDNVNFDYHIVNDLNGDGFVTGDDYTFIDNNNTNFIQRQVPQGAPAIKRLIHPLKLVNNNNL